MVQGLEKLFPGDIAADHLHVLVGRARHGIGHEADRIAKRRGGRLEPDDPLGDPRNLWGQGNLSHRFRA